MADPEGGIREKRGGICIRVDDNQAIQKWTDFAEIFNRHGFAFCAALNWGRMLGNDAYIDLAKTLQAQGHELVDHTPIHSVDKFPIPPGDDADAWRNVPGVDHVDDRLVYLSYENVRPGAFPEGRADISGNRMTGRSPGDFDEPNQSRFSAVYLPELDGIYRFRQVQESGQTVLELRSFWDEENVDLGERRDMIYHKLGKPDVHMTPDARERLVEASLNLVDRLGLRRPVTWVQPGSGGCSDLHPEEAKISFGDRFGYVAAATYPNRSIKCHNEYDPTGDRSFGMQWGNFDEEKQDLGWNKKRIADGVALHHVLIGHCHFWEHVMPDGWEGFLRRVDGLLAWCKETEIPVKTYAEWAEILYRTPQDPGVNIFPALDVDRDADGIPDGYTVSPEILDRTDAAPDGSGVSLAVRRAGRVCAVERLGGLEKGENAFGIWVKGSGRVGIRFEFPETRKTEVLNFSAENPAWTHCEGSVSVPADASLVNISIDCTGLDAGVLKAGGMSLCARPSRSIR